MKNMSDRKKFLPYLLYLAVAAVAVIACNEKNNEDVFDVPSSWISSAFGTVSFATKQTWTVGSQTWSDAVQTNYSNNKITYDGFTPDCRSNPDYKGDLFSWYAVDSFKNELCPEGWRVPTQQDFIDLDIALGGTGNNVQFDTALRDKYLNTWGGIFGGICDFGGSLKDQGSGAYYWSQSEYSSDFAYNLDFHSNGLVNPQYYIYKDYSVGFALRCVKDKE